MKQNAESLVKQLELTAHPEGGYFRETYRSSGSIKKDSVEPGMNGPRNYSTAIYFLLDEKRPSKFHRIKSDEVWHFYLGSPLEIVEIDEHNKVIKTVLGPSLNEGQTLQYVVKKNRWFGSRLLTGGTADFGLVGCTVAPGFAFDDFEMATGGQLNKIPGIETYKDLVPQ